MIAWFLGLALATEPGEPRELVDEARRRIVVGDFDGARISASEALQVDGPHASEARYLMAMGLEYSGHPDEALSIYDALLGELTDAARLDDVRFRRAEALGRANRYDEALAQLDDLGSGAARSPADAVKLEILRGLWELESDKKKSQRTGLTRIHGALQSAAPIDAPWHQAMARARLIALAAASARALPFDGSDKKKARRMDDRASLVTGAGEQLAPMIALKAPQWTMGAFLEVGRAFEAFGQAMLDESPVRGLTADQRAIYERQRSEKVEAVWVKASRYYDRGLQYAEIADWQGPETQQLREALAAVVQRVDGLAASR